MWPILACVTVSMPLSMKYSQIQLMHPMDIIAASSRLAGCMIWMPCDWSGMTLSWCKQPTDWLDGWSECLQLTDTLYITVTDASKWTVVNKIHAASFWAQIGQQRCYDHYQHHCRSTHNLVCGQSKQSPSTFSKQASSDSTWGSNNTYAYAPSEACICIVQLWRTPTISNVYV